MAHTSGSRRRFWLIGSLLLLLTLGVFRAALSAGFVRWDDGMHVYGNPGLHPVSPQSLGRFWAAPYENLYIPLSYSLYALLATMAHLPTPMQTTDGLRIDLNPRVFHTAGLLLHGANVLLVFALLRRLLPRLMFQPADLNWAAGAGALLFAIHPVQVESVAWISEMRGLLSALFCLLALQAYLSHAEMARDRRWFVLATVCLVLALLAKPSAVAVPLLALVLETLVLRRPGRAWRYELGCWGAIGVVFLILTHGAQPVTTDIVTPLWTRPLIAGDAFAFYAGKLFWPAHLGIDYGRSPVWLVAQPWFFLSSLVPCLLGLFVWLGRRRLPGLTAAAALFAAALLPTLGLTPFVFQVYSTVADRYLYLALFGPALGLAWALARLRPASPPAFRVACWSACAALLLTCALISRAQTACWQNSIPLFQQGLRVNPRSWALCNNLAAVALDRSQPDAALPLLTEAVRLRPGYAEAHANRGIALLELGNPRNAEAEFSTASQLKPNDVSAFLGLGESLRVQGRFGEAAVAYRHALALNPDLPQARTALRLTERLTAH